MLYAKLVVSDPFYSRIVQEVERECARRGYHLFLSALEPEQAAQPHAFSLVQSRRVDGLILAGPDIPARFVLELRATGLPIVLVDNALSETAMDTVLGDDSAGAMLLGLDDPRKILYRSAEPTLAPETDEERAGVVPNVVFPTGIDPRANGRLDVYYGMADSAIGVARLDIPAQF